MSMPMFSFFALGFLFFATIVAVAVWLAVRSGEKGSTKLGGFAGCAIALALLVIAGIGALGCTAIAVFNTPNEIVRRGPVKSFEFNWGHEDGPRQESGEEVPEPEGGGDHGGIRLRFEVRGVEPDQVTRWIRDNTDGDVSYTITSSEDEDGKSVQLDVSLPISGDELRRFREDFQRDFPDLRLPESIKVELRSEDDDR
ncbi:MAG: hypothetical protein ACKVXR_16905 [Planctomycetota bacterium]